MWLQFHKAEAGGLLESKSGANLDDSEILKACFREVHGHIVFRVALEEGVGLVWSLPRS